MKQCRVCGIAKDVSAFLVKRKNGRTVLRGTCKQCYDERIARMTAADSTLVRQCTTCGERKPLIAFHKHRICLYGREPVCKQCKADKRRLRDAKFPEQARSVDLKAKYGIT